MENMENIEDPSEKLFKPIGKVKKPLKKRLQTPLPNWIQNRILFPKDIQVIEGNSDYEIDVFTGILDPLLIQTCKKKNFSKLFPVQRKVLPAILSSFSNHKHIRSGDICVASPTGSGKTLTFALPLINDLMHRVQTKIRAIVILPVRDLALQVYKVFLEFSEATNLKVGISIGHKSFSQDIENIVKKDSETGRYQTLIDILVTTPSRLIDLIHNCPGFDLRYLKYLVLDEVDRTMDFEVEYNWLKEIEKAVFCRNNPSLCVCDSEVSLESRLWTCCVSSCSQDNYSLKKQPFIKLLFSATLSKNVDNLHSLNLFQPILFMASDNHREVITQRTSKDLIPTDLEEKFLVTSLENKSIVLWYMIKVLQYRRVLCFVRTLKRSRLLYSLLKSITGLQIYEFSSSLKDKERDAILKKFKDGDFDIIIATDIMTRGIDISGIQYVISYDLPYNDTQYVHRVGRTARAGHKGTAITILTSSQMKNFSFMLRRVHNRHEIRERVKKMKIRQSKLLGPQKEIKEALKKLKRDAHFAEKKLQSYKKSIPWKGLNKKKVLQKEN